MTKFKRILFLASIAALSGYAHGGYYFLHTLNHGQQSANSTSCVHGTQKFGTVGSSTFTVPNNCTQLTLKIWGAGGGGGGGGGTTGGSGGPGGFLKAVLFVVPGSKFSVRVGGGGDPGLNVVTPVTTGLGGSGGGYSGVFSEDGLTAFAVVGGGAGGGGSGSGGTSGGDGGPGGGFTGVNGQNGSTAGGIAGNTAAQTPGTKGANSGTPCNATVAGSSGITWTSGLTISSQIGGTGSTCEMTTTTAGGSWGGGSKTRSTTLYNCSGGGGGGGYYGGGGGGAIGSSSQGASGSCGGGGGGGGYAAVTVLVQQALASTSGSLNPPNASDTDRTSSSWPTAGNGGTNGTAGASSNANPGMDGLVVIQY